MASSLFGKLQRVGFARALDTEKPFGMPFPDGTIYFLDEPGSFEDKLAHRRLRTKDDRFSRLYGAVPDPNGVTDSGFLTGNRPTGRMIPAMDALKQVLMEVCGGSADKLKDLMIAFAIPFCGGILKRFPSIVGQSNTGKSTVVEGAKAINGDFCMTLSADMLLHKGKDSAGRPDPYGVAAVGPRLGILNEIAANAQFNVEVIKRYVGKTDNITARDTFGKSTEIIDVRPTITPMPVSESGGLASQDGGYWNRSFIVLLDQVFSDSPGPGEKKKNKFIDTMWARPEIKNALMYLVLQTAQELYNSELVPSKQVQEAIDEARFSDDPISDFIADNLVAFTDEEVKRADLAAGLLPAELTVDFNRWNRLRGGHDICVKTFGSRMMCYLRAKKKPYLRVARGEGGRAHYLFHRKAQGQMSAAIPQPVTKPCPVSQEYIDFAQLHPLQRIQSPLLPPGLFLYNVTKDQYAAIAKQFPIMPSVAEFWVA